MARDVKELMARVGKIRILTNKLVDDRLSGDYHSTFKGQGVEFDEVRPYLAGDDVRTIDWNVTAKTGVPHIKRFAEERTAGVLGSLAEIDALLAGLLDNWDLYRLGTVERAVLRMGIWEMKNTDVPKPVVINEAIDLANWFSTPKSRPIINGVLDKFAKSLA